MVPEVCPICDAKRTCLGFWIEDIIPLNDLELEVHAPMFSCKACGQTWGDSRLLTMRDVAQQWKSRLDLKLSDPYETRH